MGGPQMAYGELMTEQSIEWWCYKQRASRWLHTTPGGSAKGILPLFDLKETSTTHCTLISRPQQIAKR